MDPVTASKAVTSLATMLQTTGGWGVAALFGLVIWRREVYYQKAIKEKEERIFKLLDKQNEILSLLQALIGSRQ